MYSSKLCNYKRYPLSQNLRIFLMQAGVLPPFVPFAQAFAAVITAALTGSLYYMAASPKGTCFSGYFLKYSFLYEFPKQHPTFLL